MSAGAIITAAIAALALLFGGIATWWRRRLQISISVSHQGLEGRYEVVVTVANGSDDSRHLEEIHLVPVRKPTGSWTTDAIEVPAGADLPPRGTPARETLEVPRQWVDQRIPFYAKAKLSARSKVISSDRQNIQEGVLNVL